MEKVWAEIVAGIGLVLSTSITAFYGNKVRELRQEIKDLKLKNANLETDARQRNENTLTERIKIFADLKATKSIHAIDKTVDRMFHETQADRFLIIVAFNGSEKFKYISVIYQRGGSGVVLNAVDEYNHLAIDDAYNEMLYDVEKVGFKLINTNKLEQCLLKSIYRMEEVKHSVIRFVGRHPLDSQGNHILAFTSTATHSDDPFTLDELAVIHIKHNAVFNPKILRLISHDETL